MASILIVDDEPQIRRMLRRGLSMAGHEVVEAETGQQGLDEYLASPFEVVITDVHMPDMDGIEFLLALRAEDPKCRIVAISGGAALTGADFLEAMKDFGAARTLAKPFSLGELQGTVSELLGE